VREEEKGSIMAKSAARSSKPKSPRRELLRIDGRPVEVTMRLNPRARRLIVKVHPSTGEVSVVAPSRRGLDHALEFARGETEWIARRLAHVPKQVALDVGARLPFRGEEYVIDRGEGGRAPVWLDRAARAIRVAGHKEHAPRRVLDFLKREARKALDLRALEYAKQIGASPKRITVRDTASRWGSCSTTRALSFSWRLIFAPPFVLDYVVAHEVAHLRQMNHGPRFWGLVRELVGDVEKPQAWLSRNGPLLHRYAPRMPTEKPKSR
jgi:predicted metal-dependent hydrolase